MAITANGIYSDRARSLFGMQSAVATSTNSPIEVFAKGQQDLINRLTAAGKDQVQLLKAQIKLLTDIKKNQSTFGVSDLLMTKIITKFTSGLFGGLARVGTVVGATVAGSGMAAVKLLSPMTKGITEGVTKLGLFLKTGVLDTVSTTTKFFGNMFTSISRTVSSIGRPVAAVMAALTNLKAGSMADFGGGVLKSFGKVAGVLGKIGSKFLIPLAAIFTAFDLFKGFNNADEILGRNGVGIVGKIGSAISSTVNSLLLGIPDWISDKLGFKNFAQMVDSGGIALGDYASKMADTIKGAISGTFDYVASFASGITDYIKSLWESAKASSIGTFLGRVTGLFSTTSTNPTATADPSLGLSKQSSPIAATNAVAVNAIQQTNRVANTAIQTQQQGVEALEDSLDKSLKDQKNGIFSALTNFLGNTWDAAKAGAAVFGGMAADTAASIPDLVSRGAGGVVSGANEVPFGPAGVQNPSGRPVVGPNGQLLPGTTSNMPMPDVNSLPTVGNVKPGYKPPIVGGANLMSGGNYAGAAPGQNLTTITTASGKKVQVHADAAPSFLGFINELEASGYKVNQLGGYNHRMKRGGNTLSEHAYGNAIDINQDANPMGGRLVTDMPKNISEMAAKWGLSWGGDWKSTKDAMHFEWRGYRPWEQHFKPDQNAIAQAGQPGQEGSTVTGQQYKPGFGNNTSGSSANDSAMATALSKARAASFAEMDADPQLKATVLGLLSKENANHPEGPLEALVNRASAKGMSIRQAVYGGFYGPINRGQVTPLTGDAAKKYEQAYERVKAGSNDIGLRTDQGMVNEHKWADSVAAQGRGRKAQINGEWYSDMGPFGEQWAKGIVFNADSLRKDQLKQAQKQAVEGRLDGLNDLGSTSIGAKGSTALTNLYKEQGSIIGKSIVETVDSQPQTPTFNPAPISSPLAPAQPPVPGSVNAQNPKGAPSDPVSPQPSTKDISSIDEYSMLMINSSVMA